MALYSIYADHVRAIDTAISKALLGTDVGGRELVAMLRKMYPNQRAQFHRDSGLWLYVFPPDTAANISPAVRHLAHYIEIVYPNDCAEVLKGSAAHDRYPSRTTYTGFDRPEDTRRTLWARLLQVED